jgi:hypothetical protein
MGLPDKKEHTSTSARIASFDFIGIPPAVTGDTSSTPLSSYKV